MRRQEMGRKLILIVCIIVILGIFLFTGCLETKIQQKTLEPTTPTSFATIKTFYISENWDFTRECEVRKQPTFEVPIYLVIDVDSNLHITQLTYKITMSKNGNDLKTASKQAMYTAAIQEEKHYTWGIQCSHGTGSYDFKLEVLDENGNTLDTEYSTYVIEYSSTTQQPKLKDYELKLTNILSGNCEGSYDDFKCNIPSNTQPNFALYYDNIGTKTLHDIRTQVSCEKMVGEHHDFYLKEMFNYFFQNKGAIFEPMEKYSNYGEYVIQLTPEGYIQYVVNLGLAEVLKKDVCDINIGDLAKVKCTVETYSRDGPVVESIVNLDIYVDEYRQINGC